MDLRGRAEHAPAVGIDGVNDNDLHVCDAEELRIHPALEDKALVLKAGKGRVVVAAEERSDAAHGTGKRAVFCCAEMGESQHEVALRVAEPRHSVERNSLGALEHNVGRRVRERRRRRGANAKEPDAQSLAFDRLRLAVEGAARDRNRKRGHVRAAFDQLPPA
eukprot:Amastigsp_a514189_8.p3 type:complete len:163 gc:universal Amastigsp_a514189_8:986-498(-)